MSTLTLQAVISLTIQAIFLRLFLKLSLMIKETKMMKWLKLGKYFISISYRLL